MIQQLLLAQGSVGGGGYDSDAQAFFTAASITDTTQKDAVNQLVLDLKAASVWSSLLAIYPFVGGDATKHSYNLKNTANYQITWGGNIGHYTNGVQGAGVTGGQGDTGYNQQTHGTDDDEYLAVYSVTQTMGQTGVAIGVRKSTSPFDSTFLQFGTTSYSARIQSNSSQSISNSDYRGFFSANRLGTDVFINIRGTQTISTLANDRAKCNLNYYICSRNNNGTKDLPTFARLAFACIGNGLTTTEDAAVKTAVDTYQTALSRNV